jgi:hypothetical protein
MRVPSPCLGLIWPLIGKVMDAVQTTKLQVLM